MQDAKFNSADLNVAYRMKVRQLPWSHAWRVQASGLPVAAATQVHEYQRLCQYSEALEENWGKPPGNLNSNGQELLVYGKQVRLRLEACGRPAPGLD